MIDRWLHVLFPFLPDDIPVLLKTNLLLAISFITITILLFIFLVIVRRTRNRISRRKLQSRIVIEEFITTLLFSDIFKEGSKSLENKISDFAKNNLNKNINREIAIKLLTELHRNISGESAERLTYLFRKFNLHTYAIKRIEISPWDIKAKSINELAEMDISEASNTILKYINHPQPKVRLEAQVALIKLGKDSPLSFLDEIEKPFTEWQQIQFSNAFDSYYHDEMPDFSKWLNHKLPSITIFCIRMIAKQNAFQNVQHIRDLLFHPLPEIRKEAIIALRKLEDYSSVKILIEIYVGEGLTVKQEILRNITALGNSEHLHFLVQNLNYDHFEIKFLAAKAISKMGDEGKKILNEVILKKDALLKNIASQILHSTN